MISNKDYSQIIEICASQGAVRDEVLKNHDDNLWWPLSVKDWRTRMLVAGLSTRVSYQMIDVFQNVVNALNAFSYEEIMMMHGNEFRAIIKPLGLIELRTKFYYSFKDFIKNLEDNKIDINIMSHNTLIQLLQDSVFGAGYKVAQCCSLYAQGYHCGIMPVDSGMAQMLCPCIGLSAPNSSYGHEILRKQLEALTAQIDCRQIANKIGYGSLKLPVNKNLTWWVHLVLIYFKRLFCNAHKPDLCPLRNHYLTKKIVGQMCPKQKNEKSLGGINNIIIEGIDGVGKTTTSDMLCEVGFAKLHAKYHPRHKNLYAFYDDTLEAKDSLKRFVLDRTFISEIVYGPVLRGKNRLAKEQTRNLLQKLKKQGSFYVYFYAPLEVLLARRPDQQKLLLENYSALMEEYDFVSKLVSQYIPVMKINTAENNEKKRFLQIMGFEFPEELKVNN